MAKLKMWDMDEVNTFKGTSFMIYGESGSRKTRTIGSMPKDSISLHLSFDYGSSSATEAMRTLGIENAVHKVAPITNMEEFGQWLIELHTNDSYRENVDTIVIDNLVVLHSKVSKFVAHLPRFKADMMSADDILEDKDDKKAESKKTLAFHMTVQTIIRDLVHQIMELKDVYNIVVLAGDTLLSDMTKVPVPTIYPAIAGPSSIKPVVSLFDNVLMTTYTDGDFDTKDHIATKFKLSTFTDQMTGTTYFNKSRSVTDNKYLEANEIPADFRLLFKATGYVLKKDRTK